LDIDGAVLRPIGMTLDEFMALPQQDSVSDIHCVTQWSRYDNHWKGVSAQALLSIVQPRPDVNHVIFTAHDGYTANIRLDQFDQPDVFLVHQWEGRPITREHGGPVRMLVPRLYLWKSAKWLRRIHFTISDHRGFWEARGYHNNGDPWQEERYA
jgi:DMSO/TMAO reductase YedYZ molybdopterin-dependent catalytic subunit